MDGECIPLSDTVLHTDKCYDGVFEPLHVAAISPKVFLLLNPYCTQELLKLSWGTLSEDMKVVISLVLRQVFGMLIIALPEKME